MAIIHFPIRRLTAAGIILVVAIIVAALAIWIVSDSDSQMSRKPLYWVSQMDPDYRSSAPGQCPHGMDLVPVFAGDVAGFDGAPGVVRISPEVQHQMGVRKATVKTGDLKQRLRVYGRVVPDNRLVTQLSPRVKGWVDLLFVHANGETVKRGQPLFALYSPELLTAQQTFLQALASRNRADIVPAETHLRALNVDDFAIDQLKKDGVPQRSVIFRAPKDGMVDMLNISEGDYVRPRQMLLAVGSMETVWVELEVFASQASLINVGQPLTFTTPSHPGLVWEGEIDALYPHLDMKSRGQRFRATIDNTRMLLRPNMQIEAFIALPTRKPALLVPRKAVIDLGEQQRVVLDMGEGRFKSVRVNLGESNDEYIEVLEGLQEGDVVVTSAHFLIDSESSRTSDFLRMEPLEEAESEYPPAWVNATIKEINLQERKLRLQHERISTWNMPGMTMNFKVTDDVSMRDLEVGQRIRVQITDGDPLFQVLGIQPVEAGESP